MRCLHPIPRRDKFGNWADVPCGRCVACRLNKAQEWSIRITNEVGMTKDCCFLTLTYSDEYLPQNMSVSKKEMQDFMKRFRKSLGKLKIRYFLSGEYGDQFSRPHYHLILLGVGVEHPVFKNKHISKQGFWCEVDAWKKGHSFVAPVSYEVANYVARYTMKKQTGEKGKAYYAEKGIEPEFSLKSIGIGRDYCDNNAKVLKHLNMIRTNKGYAPLPRYYVNRLYPQGQPGRGEYDKEKRKWIIQKAKEFAEIARKNGVNSEEWLRQTSEANEKELMTFLKMKGKRNVE